VAEEGAPVAVVEAVAARDTLVAAEVVAVAEVAAAVVEPVADTTSLPSHCTDLSK
jgi:hypothetical protein